MLSHLLIQNFILIDRLELGFTNGLTVITGETGAGKSILIDALALLLGERADSNTIGQFQDKCDLSATFIVANIPDALAWLTEYNYETNDQECLIRRILLKDGKSRQTINGTPCTLQQLREFALLLINIHSQNQHQLLVKLPYQRQLLDHFAGLITDVDQLKSVYQNYQSQQHHLQTLRQSQENYEVQKDLLTFQLSEFEKLNLVPGEYTQIDQEHKQLANAEHYISNCRSALNLLCEGESNIDTMLHQAAQYIQNISSLNDASQLLKEASIQVSEASSEVNSLLNKLEINPERLHYLENRLAAIHTLSRKYHTPAQELLTVQQTLTDSLRALQQVSEDITVAENLSKQLWEKFQTAAKIIHDKRTVAATRLSAVIKKSIQKLGMPTGNFEVQVTWSPEYASVHGCDHVEFLISTNPGQPPQSLRKIASGGEMSRIALAIYVATAQSNTTPILVFDEIDVGIGGGTAAIVGELLKNLGQKAQVFCITHLPQVAAFSDQHYRVDKKTNKKQTATSIKLLTEEEKITEIARMLGGVTVTERTLAHAKELVEVAG